MKPLLPPDWTADDLRDDRWYVLAVVPAWGRTERGPCVGRLAHVSAESAVAACMAFREARAVSGAELRKMLAEGAA